MDYIVTRNQQVAVKAETADEAIKQVLEGKGTSAGVSYNVSIRPPPKQPTIVGGKPANG